MTGVGDFVLNDNATTSMTALPFMAKRASGPGATCSNWKKYPHFRRDPIPWREENSGDARDDRDQGDLFGLALKRIRRTSVH
jgi:hypothetical protein